MSGFTIFMIVAVVVMIGGMAVVILSQGKKI